MDTKKYELVSDAMWLDGKEHHRGDTVELESERGEELVALGALRDPSSKKTDTSSVTDDEPTDDAPAKSTRGTGAKR